MYTRVTILSLLLALLAPAAHAQTTGGGQDEHAGHVMPSVGSDIPATRDGSGTAWLPDESPMYAVHGQVGGWTLMGHGSLFVQYLHERGDRGSDQVGSINWLMGMAQRPAGAGRITLRAMVSAEAWTIGGCGYPDLLATGESCNGDAIHDRQHPHDLFMELAAVYDRPLGRGLHLQLYGGPAGEPALGPVAFMHRVSGLPNALAPMTHHWFDSTHVTFGLVTAGVYGRRWKAEGSVFNGREPDEERTDFDMGALDSWSGRVWLLPTSRWALQFSAGHLNEAEAGHDADDARVDVDRLTASATYHRVTLENVIWASTVGWGRNTEDGESTHAVLGETSITVRDRDVWYGRYEWAQKSGHDLAVEEHGVFRVAKLQGGYTRYLAPWQGLTPGVGATVSASMVPRALAATYGQRVNGGFGMYLTLRPTAR